MQFQGSYMLDFSCRVLKYGLPRILHVPTWELLALCEVIAGVWLCPMAGAASPLTAGFGARVGREFWSGDAHHCRLLQTPHCCHLKHHHSNGHVVTGSPAPGSQATSSMSGLSSPAMYPLMSNAAPGKSCSSCRLAFASTVFRTPILCHDRRPSRCP